MFWSGDKLAVEGCKILGEQFSEDRIDCAALKLSIGRESFVTRGQQRFNKRQGKLNLSNEISLGRRNVSLPWINSSFEIPSGQFAYIITEEKIAIPDYCLGFISLSTGTKFKGLINVSGFHVDPGYNGHLIYAVYNASPNSIFLSREDRVFSLWIADLAGATGEYSFPGTAKNSLDSNLISSVSAPVHSVSEFSERLNNLEGKIGLLTWALPMISLLIIVLINWDRVAQLSIFNGS